MLSDRPAQSSDITSISCPIAPFKLHHECLSTLDYSLYYLDHQRVLQSKILISCGATGGTA